MPGIKTILTVASDAASAASPIRTALTVGRGLGAHVEVAHVRPDPAAAVPYVGEAMAGALVEEMMEAAERDGLQRANATRAVFDDLVEGAGVPLRDAPVPGDEVSAAWVAMDGSEPEEIAARGRVSDLVVTGRPLPDKELPSLLTLNAVLMESGRPVLVAPPEPLPEVGGVVAIAWNGAPEAARAVRGALPFLDRADKLVILASEDTNPLCNGEALARNLAWHGLSASIQPITGHGGEEVGKALLTHCDHLGANLLVMGAYTHSRLRQLILGGVTRHVLDHATLPVLLSH